MNLLCHIGNTRHGEWLTQQAIGAKALNLGSEEARAAYWRNLEAERAKLYPWAERQIAAQFRAELAEFRRRIENGWEAESAAIDSLHPDDWRATLMRVYEHVGRKIGRWVWNGMQQPKALRAIERKAVEDVWYDALYEYISEIVGDKVVQILATTKELIKAAIREGLANGEGVFEVSRRIEALYLDEIIPHRAEVIARTETIAAAGAASRAAAKATGLNLTHEWVATPDDRTRDTHWAANGQKKPIDEPFEVGGSLLMFPGDSSLGADADQVISCRCVEVYSVA